VPRVAVARLAGSTLPSARGTARDSSRDLDDSDRADDWADAVPGARAGGGGRARLCARVQLVQDSEQGHTFPHRGMIVLQRGGGMGGERRTGGTPG
jgi:hypothetical protein